MKKVLQSFIGDLWEVGFTEAWVSLKQNTCQYLAGLVPKKIAYYVVVRVWAFSTSGQWSGEDVNLIEPSTILRRWNQFK